MIADYPCRWRGDELSPGRWACNSAKLVGKAVGVSETTCAKCYCRDHEPVAAPAVVQLGTACVTKPPAPAKKVALPCVYLGDPLPAKRDGSHKKWHECEHPDQPLGAEVCSCKGCGTRCPGYKPDTGEPELKQPAPAPEPPPPAPPPEPAPPPLAPITLPPVGRRHLAYYILPVSGNGVWQRGVDALRLRWHLFTGRKVVAIAKGGPIKEQIDRQEGKGPAARTLPLDPVEVVRAYLPADAEVIEVDNDPTQWERVAWTSLWERVLTGADEHDAVLYAHAKGVTRRPASPCHRWADLLYTLALDHWTKTEDALRRYSVVGSLVKRGAFFGPPSDQSKWHYSGNFFWLRAGDARAKIAAVPVPADRWGAEAWVGIAFPLDQAGEVFGPTGPDFHLYNPDHMNRVLTDHAAWTARHRPAPVVAPAQPANPPVGLRLSIIIATVGRPTVGRAWESAAAQTVPGDEIIVQHDATGDWGATPRTRGQRAATGDYILWMDDDDVYAPGALTAIRQALAQTPGRPHIFRMRRGVPHQDILPRVRTVKVGEVSTQMFVVPNDPARLGEWGTRYEGDFDFIASTLAKWPADALVWRDEVVAVWRPGDLPALAVKGPPDAGPTPPAWFAYDAGRLQDWHIWQEVAVADVYGMRAADLTGRAVLDVGGHIGAAAYQAHRCGVTIVHSYEPEAESLKYLRANAGRMPGVTPFAAAVGGVVTDGFRSGQPLDPPAVVSLDEAVARLASESDGRVALLKIDCEGGEWPAFAEARDLSRVDRIVGEWHRVEWRGRKWGPEDLAGLVGPHGFDLIVNETAGDCGLFTAVRRPAEAR